MLLPSQQEPAQWKQESKMVFFGTPQTSDFRPQTYYYQMGSANNDFLLINFNRSFLRPQSTVSVINNIVMGCHGVNCQ